MKVLLLGGSNSRNSGGIFETSRHLGFTLQRTFSTDVQFLMHNDEYSVDDKKLYAQLPVHDYKIIGPRKMAFSFDLHKQLARISPDLVHTQSIWMYLSLANATYTRKAGVPYVISTHGMLDPWQLTQSSLLKKLVLALYENKHLRNASCLHALCQSEYDSIRAFGIKNPIAIIPNGVDIPGESAETGLKPDWYKKGERKTLLFLSRLHHKKGLENLIKAWKETGPETRGWQLVIVGETRDQSYWELLNGLVEAFDLTDSVYLVGGQYGRQKQQCFRCADAFVLPSFSEGLPMAVLEAWSHKLPVLMTPFCNIPEGFSRKAAVEIQSNVEGIAAGIVSLVQMSDVQRLEMGLNGYALVKEKFTWEEVARSTMRMYNWVLGRSSKPEFVLTN